MASSSARLCAASLASSLGLVKGQLIDVNPERVRVGLLCRAHIGIDLSYALLLLAFFVL